MECKEFKRNTVDASIKDFMKLKFSKALKGVILFTPLIASPLSIQWRPTPNKKTTDIQKLDGCIGVAFAAYTADHISSLALDT